ncbi:chemotaxis protein CheW [Treponema sp.]|uniref:chemotaxis protein CheW n=1 Tax=Treponema sp. TaxID=166 RepID=UPI0025EBEDCC|nr:chemotaxis protein CheW [Treponema sp.]MCR5218513.1 chemotaxis protein CheW [Treponema sp.]
MDENILKAIEENQASPSENQDSEENNTTWLIFYAGSKAYATDANNVREILRNDEIFQVPFVPEYIKGVINYYGHPYAAVDFSLFQKDESQSSGLFLILNDDNDIAIQISDVREFQTINNNYLHPFNQTTDTLYFTGAIDYDNGIQHIAVPVLNFKTITERIRQDFESE